MRRLLLVVLLLLLWASTAEAWTWPVHGQVLQGFTFDKAHPYAAAQHRGIDIGSSDGATVLAPSSGTVTFAGSVPSNGLSVTIETSDGLAVTLTHLGSISIQRGASVDEGAAIGTVGPSGTPEVDGPYVHLGIRLASDPNGYLDPLSLLPPATTGVSSSPAPASSPASVPQQSSAGSAPTAVTGSTSTTASSGTAPSARPGPAGESAPVEVPATDFASHSVSASETSSPTQVSRAVPTTSAAGPRVSRTAPVTSAVAPRASVDLGAASTHRPASAGREARASAPSSSAHQATVSTTSAATRRDVTRSRRATGGGEGVDVSPIRPPAQAPSIARAPRSMPAAAPRSLLAPVAFAGATLGLPLLLLLVLGVLLRRRHAAAAAPPHEAIVLALPLARRHEPSVESQRFAA